MGRRYKKAPLTLDSPWLQLGGSARMLDIVNTYLGMWSKLSYADQWYSPPRGSEADRLGSMRWHRDYNDQHLVKVFIYLVRRRRGHRPARVRARKRAGRALRERVALGARWARPTRRRRSSRSGSRSRR